MSNAGLFATVAREYANFRPEYPPELFAWLARISPSHEVVWDCGCGSGQASVALAGHFHRVEATDVAPEQIAAARPHARVHYSVAPAERSGLAENSVDLVTVAQALHWFDVEAFYAEATRVARRGAALVVWTYPRPQFMDAEIDLRFFNFYSDVVGPYWPPERRHVEAVYRTLPFPIEEIAAPEFAIDLTWTLEQVVGYVSSWSATARYTQALGTNPVPLLRQALADVWPGAGSGVAVRMPLGVRAARLRS